MTDDLPQSQFRILSLDGGGIRGAFTAAFLAGLETILQEAGKLDSNESIAKYFELIAGTSTGGIIACGLALGKTAQEVLDFYKESGKAIFTRRHRSYLSAARQWLPNRLLRKFNIDRDGLSRSLYDSLPLKTAIEARLENKTLRDCTSRLVVPSMRLSLGRQIVFRTPHLPNQIRDLQLSAVDVVLATTAAPTYFPPHRVNNKVQPGQFVDGGVWANHPGLLAYVDALRLRKARRPGVDPNFEHSDIHLLSIGTGESPNAFEMDPNRSGLLPWAPRLVDTILTAQSQGTHFMLRHLLDNDQYTRVNFRHCGWQLDNYSKMGLMIDMGLAEARNFYGRLPGCFFERRSEPFHPFL